MISRIERDEYEKIQAINWSTLKNMLKSPAHYRQALMEKQEDTPALRMGRVIHIAVFEPEKFRAEVAVWDGGRRAGKEWEAFVEANRGLELVKTDEAELALAIGEAARRDAGPLLSKGKPEQTLQWSRDGMKCKGRVDFLSAELGVIDLKSARDAGPVGFGAATARLGYLAQAAYYVDGIEAITGKRVGYTLFAVEKVAPFVPGIYPLDEDHLALGRAVYEPLLARVKECREASHWPGYGTQKLVLPRWAVPFDDDPGMGLDWSNDNG